MDRSEIRAHLARVQAENAAGRERLAELIATAVATQAASHAARERCRQARRRQRRGDAGASPREPGDEQERAAEPDPLEADDADW